MNFSNILPLQAPKTAVVTELNFVGYADLETIASDDPGAGSAGTVGIGISRSSVRRSCSR